MQQFQNHACTLYMTPLTKTRNSHTVNKNNKSNNIYSATADIWGPQTNYS